MFKAGSPMTYYKHQIDRKGEFIDVLNKYLSPECVGAIPYLSKRPRENARKHILLFSLLDMSYEDEILRFSCEMMRDISEMTPDESPALKTVIFKYDPTYKERKQAALKKDKDELKRWLKNPDDFIESYEAGGEMSDEVLVDEEEMWQQHVLVKDGRFLKVLGNYRDIGYSFMFINDYDFSYTHTRKVRFKEGTEEISHKMYYKKDGDRYYSWRSVHACDLRLVPSQRNVGFFYYEGTPNYRVELNKATYNKYKALSDVK